MHTLLRKKKKKGKKVITNMPFYTVALQFGRSENILLISANPS